MEKTVWSKPVLMVFIKGRTVEKAYFPFLKINLTIDYRAPTPLHKPLEFRAHVASTEKRKIITKASLHHEETLCAEATGIFVSMRPEVFERLTQLRDA